MTERVFDLAVAVAPKHIGERHRDFRAGAHRLLEDGVRVLDVKKVIRKTLKNFFPKKNPYFVFIM